jgi:hypothetical protein
MSPFDDDVREMPPPPVSPASAIVMLLLLRLGMAVGSLFLTLVGIYLRLSMPHASSLDTWFIVIATIGILMTALIIGEAVVSYRTQHEPLHVAPIAPAGFQKPGHAVAAEERQVAAEQHPIDAREGALELVGVLGDELVHSRIAHELRREGNPLPTRLARVLDRERPPILPRYGFGETHAPLRSLIAASRSAA